MGCTCGCLEFFMGRAPFHLDFIVATRIIKEYFLREAETWGYFRNICFLKHLRHLWAEGKTALGAVLWRNTEVERAVNMDKDTETNLEIKRIPAPHELVFLKTHFCWAIPELMRWAVLEQGMGIIHWIVDLPTIIHGILQLAQGMELSPNTAPGRNGANCYTQHLLNSVLNGIFSWNAAPF